MTVAFSEVMPSLELDEMPSSTPRPRLFVVLANWFGLDQNRFQDFDKSAIEGLLMSKV